VAELKNSNVRITEDKYSRISTSGQFSLMPYIRPSQAQRYGGEIPQLLHSNWTAGGTHSPRQRAGCCHSWSSLQL